MQYDWLLGIPKASWKEQEEWVAERLAADPVAAAISDDEAEVFFAILYMVRFMAPGMRTKMTRAFGVPIFNGGERGERLSTVAILRKWKQPKTRDILTRLLPNTGYDRWPDPAEHPEAWTEELFYDAFHNKVNVVWLARVRRHLGKADNLSEWFDSLAGWAEREYRLWLDTARLTLRRIVYTDAAPRQREVAAASQVAVAELRAKDKQTGTLRHDLRRLERDRKWLKKRARRVEHEARASISQARGEVAAARRALHERLATHGQELAAQARQFELELKLLQQRLASARTEFVQSLTALEAGSRRPVLKGRRITVTGYQGSEEVCRQLVESLGGTYLPEGGEVVLSASAGLAALERELRNLALQKVLIKCDGLYRRKEERPGIAVSGLQVHVGGQVFYQDTRVVSCGPWAGSLMAEYGAVALAMNWLLSAGPPPGAQVVIWSDCRSLLSRLARTRGVRRKVGCVTLDALVRRAVRLLRKRGNHVQLRWVPREEVHAVDRLCASAYRDLRWYHRPGSRPGVPIRQFILGCKCVRKAE